MPSYIFFQILPLQSLVPPYRDDLYSLKNLSLAVYSQCRRIISQTVPGKSMTGFGPAAAAMSLLAKPTDVSARAVATL